MIEAFVLTIIQFVCLFLSVILLITGISFGISGFTLVHGWGSFLSIIIAVIALSLGTLVALFGLHLHRRISEDYIIVLSDMWQGSKEIAVEAILVVIAVLGVIVGTILAISRASKSGWQVLGGIALIVIGIGAGAATRKLNEDIGINDFTEWERISNSSYPDYVSEPTNEPQLSTLIRQFRPSWVNREGRPFLEGGENGNNANLAGYLRKNGMMDVETEKILPNRSRVDILVNKNTVLECKPTLLSTDTLHKLQGEMNRARKSGDTTYGVIYGDARDELLDELREAIGQGNVIVLGNIKSK